MFPVVGEFRIRGYSLRIKGHFFRKEMKRNLFGQRVVNLWNSLPQRTVEAKSFGIFKAEIDRFLIRKGVKDYGEKAGQ